MSCKKCKCKVCSCIVNEQVKIAINKIVQNPDEKGVVNIKVPTKTSELINDSGFRQGGQGDLNKIDAIRQNGSLVEVINKVAQIITATRTSQLTNDSNFTSKEYVDDELRMYLTVAGAGLYTDIITPASAVPVEGDKVFLVTQPGTYINFGNVILPANHFGFIFKNGNNFSIQSVEIPMQDLTAVVAKDDIKTGNVFKLKNVVNDKYVNADGVITDYLGTSYGFIDLDPNKIAIQLYIPKTDGNNRRSALLDASGNILTVINNNNSLEFFTVTYNENAVKLIFTIEPPGNTINIDKSKIRASYDNINDFYVEEILDSKIIASKIAENEQNIEFINKNSNIIKESFIYNLVNPNEVHKNSTWSNGNYIESSFYHATGLIEIKDLQPLFAVGSNGNSAPVRSWRELNSEGIQVHLQTAGDYGVITPQKSTTKYLIVVFYETVPFDGLCISKTNDGYKNYTGEVESFILKSEQNVINDNSIINKKALDESLENVQVDYKTIVNLSNSDKILYTGSSSIESFYSPDYKAWVNKLQDFLDWQIVPYGWNGQGANSIAQKLQADTPTQIANGVKPSEINPTFVFIGQTLNSNDLITEEFDTSFIESNENLLRSAVSRTGAKPIIGTAYRTDYRYWIENSLKQLADKWGADFIPIGSYHRSMIRSEKYAGFYGGGHPAIRTHEAYTLPLLRYFNQLPRPKQGILLFEARNQISNISDLSYKDNFKRAEKFRSIQVGEMSLDNSYQQMYDRLDESGYTIKKNNTSQYMKLLKKQSIQLSNIVLLEVIVPKVRTEKINIDLVSDNITNYYVYNSFTQQFESIDNLEITNSRYIEFDKVKILLVGQNITLTDINVSVVGGMNKTEQTYNRITPPQAGKTILASEGFDDSNISNWNIGSNTKFNLTAKYGDAKFNDMPKYLGENKDVIQLTDILKRDIALADVETFGYRKLRIWTCARLYPKIYNPDAYTSWSSPNENPYTDVSWYDKNKYDYDDLNIILKYKGVSYENQCKSINVQKVGLFWDLGYIDVELPITRNSAYELQIFRGTNNNDYPMEICDVSVELL